MHGRLPPVPVPTLSMAPGDPTPATEPTRGPSAAPSWRYLAWRLFFTKRNELDLGYAFLIPFLALFFVAFVRAATGRWTVSTAMWTALVSVVGSMLVATVPLARARIMRDRDYSDGMSLPPYQSDSMPFSTAPAEDAR